MRLEQPPSGDTLRIPTNVSQLLNTVWLRIPSLYVNERYPENLAPNRGAEAFGRIENYFQWGLSPFWDEVTANIQGARQHSWELPYTPGHPIEVHYGRYYNSEEILPDRDYEDRDDWDEDEPEEEAPLW